MTEKLPKARGNGDTKQALILLKTKFMLYLYRIVLTRSSLDRV